MTVPAAINDLQTELPYATYEEAVMKPWSGMDMTQAEQFIAGKILAATSEAPIKQVQIIAAVNRELNCPITERQVRAIVRNLRRVHCFPICTRKGAPAGYWWGRTEEELAEFVKVWKAQFLDEATTLSIMLKKNYPRLAGQLRLDLSVEE
jgi:hypothetical protein